MPGNSTNGPSYIQIIQSLMPGSKVIKLKGYSGNNKDYSKAKHPVGKWKDSADLTDKDIESFLAKKHWIGATIPPGRIVVDVDDSGQGDLLKDLLEAEGINHHAIKTPNGYQFLFAKSDENKINQVTKFYTSIGIIIDTRTPGSGYIVWPTHNTEGRFILTQSLDQLDELPAYLKPVWNSVSTKDYSFPIPFEGEGSRNSSLYDFARRLRSCGVQDEVVSQGIHLIYEHFIYDKTGFPLSELKTTIQSVMKLKIETNKTPSTINYQPAEAIPYPYKVLNNALFKVESKTVRGELIEKDVMVARHVPVIKRELHNVERPQVYFEVAWNDRGRPILEMVPAGALATKKEMMPLADKGFPCTDNNVKNLIDYFDKVLAYNEIKQSLMVERLGHIKKGFAHPLLASNYDILPTDQGEKQLLEAFQVAGTVDDWIQKVFIRIKTHPRALFMVLASFASVLLHDLKIDPFIVDLASSTSQGKTTVLKVAASVWGTGQLVNEFNATKVSMERKAAFLNSFPLIMDDSRKADERLLQSFVYNFSGGRSKGRGSISGSQREFTWKNIMLTTGEVPLNEYAAKAGGAAARIISLNDSPFEEVGSHFFTNLYGDLEQNYGVIGLEFLKKYQEQKKELVPSFHKFKEHYLGKSQGNEVLTRLSLFYAAVHFAGRLLKDFFKINVDLHQLDQLFDDVAKENKAIDKPRQLLEEILQDLDSNRDSIYYDYQNYPPKMIKAIYRGNILYLTPSYLKDFLGPEMKMIRKEWLRRGITCKHIKRGNVVDYTQLFFDGRNFQVVPVVESFIEELGFDFTVVKDPKRDFYGK